MEPLVALHLPWASGLFSSSVGQFFVAGSPPNILRPALRLELPLPRRAYTCVFLCRGVNKGTRKDVAKKGI
jgi:hypothetical protein